MSWDSGPAADSWAAGGGGQVTANDEFSGANGVSTNDEFKEGGNNGGDNAGEGGHGDEGGVGGGRGGGCFNCGEDG